MRASKRLPACLSVLLLGVAPVAWAEVDMGELAALRAADRHGAAADLGLQAVLAQPWDHSLRYLVADSLERAGRWDEAASQFSALQGTPLQGAARGRLATLAGRANARPAAAPVRVAAAPAVVAPSPPKPPVAAAVAAPNQTARAAASPAPSPSQPRRLGAPSAPTTTPVTSQPRRLGAPAPATLPPPPTLPSRLGAPAAAPTTPVASQPKRLGAPAPATLPPPPAQPRRLGAPAAVPATPVVSPPPRVKTETAAEQVEALFASGQYAKAGERGLALLANGRVSPDLHLKIANSLAWSGQAQAAQAQYRALFETDVDRQARLGLANTQRWSGRPDLAARGFQSLLAEYPDDADTVEGLRLSRFDLAPRTTLSMEQTTDISPIERNGVSLGHRWHNAAGDTRYEVKLSRFDDSVEWVIPANGARDPEIPRRAETHRQRLSASIELLAHPLQPQLMLALQQQVADPPQPPLPPRLAPLEAGLDRGRNDDAVFGSARIKLYEWPVWLRASRLDWSHEALAPRAALLGLVARHLGLEAQGDYAWGQLHGQLDHFSITDDNSVSAAQLRWVPAWRPLGARWRPNVALDFRQADVPSPFYWSPAIGHGSANVGLSGDWSKGRWDLYGSAQYGVPLLDESGTSWSVSLGGRYRVAPDLALSFNFWRMSSERDNAAYRARTASVQVEKVWR